MCVSTRQASPTHAAEDAEDDRDGVVREQRERISEQELELTLAEDLELSHDGCWRLCYSCTDARVRMTTGGEDIALLGRFGAERTVLGFPRRLLG